MAAIIEPIKNTDGSTKTNVQIVRESAAILKRLREGAPGISTEQRRKEIQQYNTMIHGEKQIADWFDTVAAIEDDDEAQKFIENSLIPIDVIRPDLNAKAITKKERIKKAKGV